MREKPGFTLRSVQPGIAWERGSSGWEWIGLSVTGLEISLPWT